MRLSFMLHINIWCLWMVSQILQQRIMIWPSLTSYFNEILLLYCWLGDAILVLIRKMFVFSLYYNFSWRILYIIYFRDLQNLSLTCESYCWVLPDSQLFLKFVPSPEGKNSLFSKCRVIFLYITIHCPLNVKFEYQKSYVIYFICSENVNSSEICQ